MKNSKKIGIVTVLYNSETVIEDFFRTLDAQSYRDFVLYAVDNQSPDRSLSLAKKMSSCVGFQTIFIENPLNYGVAKGNNIGIKKALEDGCDYILLSNNDIVLTSETISILLDTMLSFHATMATPKIYYYGTDKIWCAGGDFDYVRGGAYHYGQLKEDNADLNAIKFINYSPTCFMLIEKDVFHRIGFMDERYFVYYDDTDFLYRCTRRGKESLLYVPKSLVWHKVSTSTGGALSDFSLKYMSRNQIYFILKHFSAFQKVVAFSYLFIHSIIRKPFLLSTSQCRLIISSYKEGFRMYKNKDN